MYCEPQFSYNVERSEHSLRSGGHPGPWTRASLRAPRALHFLATISPSSSPRYLIERSSPEPNSDPSSTLYRTAPTGTGRARSFLDVANDRLRRRHHLHATPPSPSADRTSPRHLLFHHSPYFRYLDP